MNSIALFKDNKLTQKSAAAAAMKGDEQEEESIICKPDTDQDPDEVTSPSSSTTPAIRREPDNNDDPIESKPSSSMLNQGDIFKAVQVVERDSLAIADSFTSLFSSLRLALSQATNTSVDHMQCFSDAAGRLQESTLDAATRGNRYINSCLRLNAEMKGIDGLATKLKILRRNVDALDSAVNTIL